MERRLFRESICVAFGNVLLFGLWVGTPILAPEGEPLFIRAFGQQAFGKPVMSIVFLATALLFLPLIPGLCGLFHVGFVNRDLYFNGDKMDDHSRAKLIGERRTAMRFAWVSLAYFLIISICWTTWAGMNGL